MLVVVNCRPKLLRYQHELLQPSVAVQRSAQGDGVPGNVKIACLRSMHGRFAATFNNSAVISQ